MHPDKMLERIRGLGTKAQVAKAIHKHKDVSRLTHEDDERYGEKIKTLASILVGLEKENLRNCGIISYADCADRLEQVELRYKHTEVAPLYHRISLEFAFIEGFGVLLRIADMPLHSDWFEVDIYELEGSLTASARLWLDSLGLTNPITSENVVYY